MFLYLAKEENLCYNKRMMNEAEKKELVEKYGVSVMERVIELAKANDLDEDTVSEVVWYGGLAQMLEEGEYSDQECLEASFANV